VPVFTDKGLEMGERFRKAKAPDYDLVEVDGKEFLHSLRQALVGGASLVLFNPDTDGSFVTTTPKSDVAAFASGGELLPFIVACEDMLRRPAREFLERTLQEELRKGEITAEHMQGMLRAFDEGASEVLFDEPEATPKRTTRRKQR
jgi:hypothetical protein